MHSNMKVSDFETLFPESEAEREPVEDEQVLKVKNEMRSTMEALSNITDMLNKPKKKYQFYNTSLQKADLKEIHEKYEIQEEKRLDETNLHINQYCDNSA